jgi:UDP-glucose 4-epimerase
MKSKYNYIVTGSNGFIGRNLVDKLILKGETVLGIDINYPANAINSSNFQFLQLDITNFENTHNTIHEIDFECIIHLAASADVVFSVENPLGDFESNVTGTLSMLEICRRKKNAKFIFASSVSVFDKNNTLPLNELSLIKASSPYGAGKASCENYCHAYFRSYGLNVNIARMFNVYGPGINKLFVYDIIKKIDDNDKEITIWGDGNQIRDYLFIDDLINGIILISRKGVPGEDYNICSGQPIRLIKLVKAIATVMKINEISIIKTKKSYSGDINAWYGDCSKIERLGFEIKTGLLKGLKETIKYINDYE